MEIGKSIAVLLQVPKIPKVAWGAWGVFSRSHGFLCSWEPSAFRPCWHLELPWLCRTFSSTASFHGVLLGPCLALIQGKCAYLFTYRIGSFV